MKKLKENWRGPINIRGKASINLRVITRDEEGSCRHA